MSLGFHVLEELINADNSILFKINEHVKQQKTVINQYDINYTQNTIDAFDLSEKCGVIVLKDDNVYRCNPNLQENIDELGDIKGLDIRKIILREDGKQYESSSIMKSGNAMIETKNYHYEITMDVTSKKLVISKQKGGQQGQENKEKHDCQIISFEINKKKSKQGSLEEINNNGGNNEEMDLDQINVDKVM